MLGSRQLHVSGLVFGVIATLAACSSVTSSPTASPPASQNLELASCIEVGIEAPKVVTEGKGVKATLSVRNICEADIQLPLTKSTSVSEGKETGVENSFNLAITDFDETVHPDDPTIKGGYLVRWLSGDEGHDYDDTMKMVTLAPDEKLERELSWDGHLRDGPALAAGRYRVWAGFDLVPAGISNWEVLVPERAQEIKSLFEIQQLDIVAE